MCALSHEPPKVIKKFEGCDPPKRSYRLRREDMVAIQKACEDCLKGKITEAELDRREAEIHANARRRPKDDWPDNYSEQFWEAYPNPVGKRDTLKALAKLRKKSGKPSWVTLMDGVRRYEENHRYGEPLHGQRWLNPENWIEGERWNDQPARE